MLAAAVEMWVVVGLLGVEGSVVLGQGLGHLVLHQLPVRLFEKWSERVRDPVTLSPRPHNIIDAANT